MPEDRCPTCGALLRSPAGPCPFCAEAQRILRQLTEAESVRLCTHCGAILQDDEEDVCRACRLKEKAAPVWRRDDRIAAWIRERFVEPGAGSEAIVCPHCRQAVPLTFKYCPHCGRPLALAPTETPVTEAIPAAVPEKTAAEEAVSAPSEAEIEVSRPPERSISAEPAPEPFWQQARKWLSDQFRPARPSVEEQRTPFWQQVGGFLRSLFRLKAEERRANTLLLVLLAVLLLGLVAVALFWLSMLRSGTVILR